jgi:hypothetical protein
MNTEKHAAEVLLDRGVTWPVKAPWFLWFLGKRKVSIKALRLGTLLELSRLYTAAGIDLNEIDKDPHVTLQDHLKPICRIVAVSILNSKIPIRLLAKPLERFIIRKFTANMLLEVMVFIATFSGYTSFLSTIRLIGDLKVTTPKNLSPEDQGSQQK